MATLVDHNYGTPVEGVPPLLAVPLLGTVAITVKDSNDKIVGQTTANRQGEWRQPFMLDDGTYTVEFAGRFRPIGVGHTAFFHQTTPLISINITVPLIPSDEDEDASAMGATGPKGDDGISGPSGGDGATGPDGEMGPTGAEGPSGPSGTIGSGGPRGPKGDDGGQGSRGLIGPAGPVGPVGTAGIAGSTGPAGTVGTSCEIDIGTPSDGYISDGLLVWTPTTPVCDALDDVNEILLDLAPATPLSLLGVTLTSTATTFSGLASDKLYQNYKSAAGEDVGAYIGGAIVLTDSFTLTNPTVGDSEAGGDDTFYPGDEGTLSSRITESGTEAEQGSLDLTTGLPSPVLSLTLNAQNAGYNGFTMWVRGDATIAVSGFLSTGYNKIIMRHVVSSETRDSASYEVFYDTSSTVASFTVTPSLAVTITVTRELSGIPSYTIGSQFVLAFVTADTFKDTYQTDAFAHSGFTGTTAATIALADSAWDGTVSSPADVLDAPDLSGGSSQFAVNTTVVDVRSTDARITVTLQKPGRSNVTSLSPSESRLIDTFSDGSTDLDEPFDDENYRLPDYDAAEHPDNYDEVPGSVTGNWDSTADLIDGEAAVFHGSLYDPTNIGSSGDFSGFLPVGPDYSSFTSDAIYLRAFRDSSDPHNSGTIELEGLTVADISPVGSGNVNVEIKLPTETGWLDLGKIFNLATFLGEDGDGCQTSQSSNTWSFTFGTVSTANSEFIIIVRVTIRTATSSISRMRITDW